MPRGAWSTSVSSTVSRKVHSAAGASWSNVFAGGTSDLGVSTIEASTYTFNGVEWTARTDLSTGRKQAAICGTASSNSIICGGIDASSTRLNSTEEFNGTAWSAGGTLATQRYNIAGGAGTESDGLIAGGYGPSSENLTSTEEYSGTTWSGGGALNNGGTGNSILGASSSAAMRVGSSAGSGDYVEEYNGTSWATLDDITAGGSLGVGQGTVSAAFYAAYYTSSGNPVTYEYDGTSWATSGYLFLSNGNPAYPAGTGNTSGGYLNGGSVDTSMSVLTFEYNPPIEIGNVKVSAGIYYGQGTEDFFYHNCMQAETNDTVVFVIVKDDDIAMSTVPSGYTSVISLESNNNIWQHVYKRQGPQGSQLWEGDVEEYVVISIAISGVDYSTLTASSAAVGTNALPTTNTLNPPLNSFVLAGIGVDTSNLYHYIEGQFEEIAKDVTSSGGGAGSVAASIGGNVYDGGNVWVFSGFLINDVWVSKGVGTVSAALSIAGRQNDTGSSETNRSEEYNGTSWASGGLLATGRYNHGASGTQTLGLAWGGGQTTAATLDSTEEYNGTSWSGGGTFPTTEKMMCGCGTQTDTLSVGGAASNDCETYNGTSWSDEANTSINRRESGAVGTTSDALTFGGYNGLNSTEEFNGTSWSTGDTLVTGTIVPGEAGTPTSTLLIVINAIQEYDGTSWKAGRQFTSSFSRGGAGGCGASSSSAISIGGYGSLDPTASSSDPMNYTEEYQPADYDVAQFTIEGGDEWVAWSLYIELEDLLAFFEDRIDNISIGDKAQTAAQLNGVLVS